MKDGSRCKSEQWAFGIWLAPSFPDNRSVSGSFSDERCKESGGYYYSLGNFENLALSFSPFALLADLWHLSTCLFIIRVPTQSRWPALQPRCARPHMLHPSGIWRWANVEKVNRSLLFSPSLQNISFNSHSTLSFTRFSDCTTWATKKHVDDPMDVEITNMELNVV